MDVTQSRGHAEFVNLERTGQALIGVDPAVARRLLVKGDGASLLNEIGEDLRSERAIVRSSFALSWICFLASTLPSALTFGWWSMLIIPVSFVLWALFLGRASMGSQRLWRTSAFLGLSILACFLSDAYLPFQIWLAVFAGSFFLVRFTYWIATKSVRSLVIRNPLAFRFLEGRGVKVVYTN